LLDRVASLLDSSVLKYGRLRSGGIAFLRVGLVSEMSLGEPMCLRHAD